MKAAGKMLSAVLLLMAVGFSHVFGQSNSPPRGEEFLDKAGNLNVWTTESVLRQKTGQYPEFLTVRFGTHKGFDRVVFELKGDLVGYFINYGKPPFQSEDGGRRTRVRGKAFVEIELYPVKSWDENIEANEKVLIEQNKVWMPLIREVKPVEWFEAELRYVVGLKKETPYRVQVLTNPTRLIIDFKH